MPISIPYATVSSEGEMREKVLDSLDHAIFKLEALGKIGTSNTSLLNERGTTGSPSRAFKYSSMLISLLGWRAVRLFLDSCKRYLTKVNHRQLMKAYTARLIEQMYHGQMRSGKSADEFRQSFLDFAKTLSSNQRRFLTDDEDLIQLPYKRQPSLVESFDATLTRFEFMKNFPHIRGVSQIFVGGSMAYGSFLNVRKGMASSDIDIVAVVNDEFFIELDSQIRTETSPFAQHQWDSFYQRKAVFARLSAEHRADVFSHRFDVETEGFKVSMHFFPLGIFDQVFGGGLEHRLSDNKAIIKTVKDFKAQPYDFDSCDRWNFSGEKYAYTLPAQQEVDKGYVADMPAYMIEAGRFYPGFYHHIVMPSHIILNTKSDVALDDFAKLMFRRARHERRIWSEASLLKSHPRRSIIAPGKFSKYE